MIPGAFPLTVHSACAAQCIGAFGAVLAMAIMPPANGAMLLIPVSRDAQVAQLALAHGALLLAGNGDRVVVRGARRALWWPMLQHGVLTVAAPRGACGEGA